MISYTLKRTYYALLKYPMRVNAWIYKNFRCPQKDLKIHLGPGQSNYLEGWVNVDANFLTSKVDLVANLLDPLPFKNDSVDIFYYHHVIEHLPDSYLSEHLKQMFEALRPGGGVRIGAPHLGNCCRKYLEKDCAWFSDFPDKRNSVGGKFTNYIFCRGEHLTALDETYLSELAESIGFVDINFCLPTKETNLIDLGIDTNVLSKEWESDFTCPHTVIMEAKKPSK